VSGVDTRARKDSNEHTGDDGGSEDRPERQAVVSGHCERRSGRCRKRRSKEWCILCGIGVGLTTEGDVSCWAAAASGDCYRFVCGVCGIIDDADGGDNGHCPMRLTLVCLDARPLGCG
jgi:hypothetical protein